MMYTGGRKYSLRPYFLSFLVLVATVSLALLKPTFANPSHFASTSRDPKPSPSFFQNFFQDFVQKKFLLLTPPLLHATATPNLTPKEKLEKNFELILRGNNQNPTHYTLLSDFLQTLPSSHASAPTRLILRSDDPNAPRGLGGRRTIILRTINQPTSELLSVFTHELGHTVDLGLIHSSSGTRTPFKDGTLPIYSKDPSLKFYSLCWQNNTEMKPTCSEKDFVSGYARTDPYEDFAESYTYYILHGLEFKEMSTQSATLRAKYNYLRSLFHNREFATGDPSRVTSSRVWDITLLPLQSDLLTALSPNTPL